MIDTKRKTASRRSLRNPIRRLFAVFDEIEASWFSNCLRSELKPRAWRGFLFIEVKADADAA
jgi:hypothetical protein